MIQEQGKYIKKMIVLENTKKKQKFLNENIPFAQIILISEGGKKRYNTTKSEALIKAKKSGLDLLCVAPLANPPICKFIKDYQKKNVKKIVCKEIKISFSIEKGDLEVKLKKIQKLIKTRGIVKISLIMRGGERIQQNLGKEKCQKIIERLQEQLPKINLISNIRQQFGGFHFSLGLKR